MRFTKQVLCRRRAQLVVFAAVAEGIVMTFSLSHAAQTRPSFSLK